MMKWIAVNRADINETYSFKASSFDDARHKVINTLDCSKAWTIYCDEDEEN